MNHTEQLTIIKALLSHRSVRKYLDKPIDEATMAQIFAAGQAASSSSFLQSVSIIVVDDPSTRTQFRQISNNLSAKAYADKQAAGEKLGHSYVERCAKFLVFCMDNYRHHKLAPDGQYDLAEVGLIGVIDTAIMAQNMLAAAESLGLGGVYIGSLRNDLARASELLDLPEHTAPLFGLCLGYPDPDAPINQSMRPRLPKNLVVHQERYHAPSKDALDDYNKTVQEYYKSRGLALDWQTQIKNTFVAPARDDTLAFLQAKGFFKR